MTDVAGFAGEVSRRKFVGSSLVGLGALGIGADAFLNRASAAAAPAIGGGPKIDGKPVRGGTLRVGMLTAGASETINVLTAFNAQDIMRLLNLYDLMFTQGSNGQVGPGLIEEGRPNADATLWTFRVRSGVTFHDGKPLTADDIVYTIQQSWGNSQNAFNAVLKEIVDFKGVHKTGPLEVQIPLLRGVAQFPTVTCFPNCVVVQDGTKDFANGVGTGPFKFVSFRPGSSSMFAANKSYWRDGQPYVDRLAINSTFSSDAARVNALLAGAIDIAPAAPASLAQANAASDRLVFGNQPSPGFICLAMRVDQGVFKDERVRRALKLIPEREQYVDVAVDGYGTVGNDLGGATDQYFAADFKGVHDPDQAKSLLKAAGAEDLKLTLDTSDAFEGLNSMALLFAQQAKKAGVTVNLNQMDPTTYYTDTAGYLSRPFSTNFFTSGVNSLAVYHLLALFPSGPYNDTHWGSDGDNALLFDALRETDTGKANDKWHAVQKRQFDSGGYIVPANINWLDFYAPKVRGIQTTPAMNCNNFDFATAWIEA